MELVFDEQHKRRQHDRIKSADKIHWFLLYPIYRFLKELFSTTYQTSTTKKAKIAYFQNSYENNLKHLCGAWNPYPCICLLQTKTLFKTTFQFQQPPINVLIGTYLPFLSHSSIIKLKWTTTEAITLFHFLQKCSYSAYLKKSIPKKKLKCRNAHWKGMF